MLTITRKKSKVQALPYQIIESTSKLESKDDWKRVVAAFVTGQQWQFKGWIWNSPPEIFANVRGFFLGYDDEQVPPLIKNWDVKILTVNKHKRHLDSTAKLVFWNTLDEFVQKKKGHLNIAY